MHKAKGEFSLHTRISKEWKAGITPATSPMKMHVVNGARTFVFRAMEMQNELEENNL